MFQDRRCLVDNVLHVGARLFELFTGEQLLDPAWIEVDEVARAAAHVCQVLDREAQTTGAGRPHHQPIMVSGEMLVADLFAELAVIDLVILPADALFGHSGGSAGFKDIKWTALELRRNPNLRLKVAKPFLLEMRKACDDVVEGADFLRGIPVGLLRPIEPERATSFGREMPSNHFACVSVELFLRLFRSGWPYHQSGSSSCFGSGSQKEAIKPTR